MVIHAIHTAFTSKDMGKVLITTKSPPYGDWLLDWTSLLMEPAHQVQVPAAATQITSPLIVDNWRIMLADYPLRELAHFFISGIQEGFRIGFSPRMTKLKSAKRNMSCALKHPAVVESYLADEITHGRVSGPFSDSSVPHAHISRFGVIPKNHQPNKWRLILDLSHPRGHSVNSGISKELCSLSYITIDNAIAQAQTLGRGTLLTKIDIKSAFRLLPVHPVDRHMLVMKWKQQLYIDNCLPFGLRSAPKLFNILADLLSWILEQQGVSPIMHYLDDFLTLAPPDSLTCQRNLDIIRSVCLHLGVPLAVEKVECPSTSLTFLGIVLDTVRMEARLPIDKLRRIRHQVRTWLSKRKATKRQILSLVGLLQHATKVVRPGHTFLSRMYSTAAKLKQSSHRKKLSAAFHSDLRGLNVFMTHWNGISFLHYSPSNSSPDSCIETDASGSWGCGAWFDGLWFQYKWPADWAPIGIMAKELVPILFSCVVWGSKLSRLRVQFKCDNLPLVEAINKGSSKDNMVMHLLRCLWFFSAYFDISITAIHFPGVLNTLADMLSRNQVCRFLHLHPEVSFIPTFLPPSLLSLLSPHQLDWTSPAFIKLFKQTVAIFC